MLSHTMKLENLNTALKFHESYKNMSNVNVLRVQWAMTAKVIGVAQNTNTR